MSGAARVVYVGQSLNILDWLLVHPRVHLVGVWTPLTGVAADGWFTRCVTRSVPISLGATPDTLARELPAGVDLGVCAHFDPISSEVLSAVRLGFINLHPALLPEYAGRYPLIEMTLAGEREGGATLHWMSARVDQGDIIGQARFAVAPLDGPVELEIKAEHLGLGLLREHWDGIIGGYAPRLPQPQRVLRKSSRLMPCPTEARSGVALWRLIHAYGPYGGVGVEHTYLGVRLRILGASLCLVSPPALSRSRVSSLSDDLSGDLSCTQTTLEDRLEEELEHELEPEPRPALVVTALDQESLILKLEPEVSLSSRADSIDYTLTPAERAEHTDQAEPAWGLRIRREQLLAEVLRPQGAPPEGVLSGEHVEGESAHAERSSHISGDVHASHASHVNHRDVTKRDVTKRAWELLRVGDRLLSLSPPNRCLCD